MHPAKQVSSVIASTALAATLASVVVGWFGASALGICDPKFGCTFGLQFGALVAAVLGLVASIVVICFSVAYTAFSARSLPPKRMLQMATIAGLAIGSTLAVAALASYA